MSAQPGRALAVPYLGVLASLQLIDPSVANTALVKADQILAMHGATLALAVSMSTLAQAATVLLMGFLGDRLERRRVLMAGLYLLGRALAGIAVGAVLVLAFATVGTVSKPDPALCVSQSRPGLLPALQRHHRQGLRGAAGVGVRQRRWSTGVSGVRRLQHPVSRQAEGGGWATELSRYESVA
jgi:MFS family permease